jgi:dolichol-phosphate mannosyltransferase
MVRNSFISVVSVIDHAEEYERVPALLQASYETLSTHFSDFEIVLVNNTALRSWERLEKEIPAEVRPHVYLINLSSHVNRNHAILAGLDRSNGDYTVILEFQFIDKTSYILDLYDKTQEGFDIVYLQAPNRQASWNRFFFYKAFYYILKNYSQLKIDEKAHNTRIISRRSLNSILRMRENLRYMKAIYSLVGYPTAALSVPEPLAHDSRERFSEQFRTSLVAITSFTTFLRSVMLWLFISSFIFLVGVVFNAIKVKLTNIDLFGNYHEAVSGWTFLVVLISVFFAVTCLNLYLISIYLSNIYQEIKHRPLYLVESVRRL